MTAAALDPIRFEVVRNALTSATEEMAATIRRAAYSTNIKTRADFSCCFLDRDLRVVAQSFAQPIHLGNLSNLVPNAVRQYGADRLVEFVDVNRMPALFAPGHLDRRDVPAL